MLLLLPWIDENKLQWSWLCKNPNAISLLEKNQDKINWSLLSRNTNAINLLEKFIKIKKCADGFLGPGPPNSKKVHTRFFIFYFFSKITPIALVYFLLPLQVARLQKREFVTSLVGHVSMFQCFNVIQLTLYRTY